MNVIYQAIYAKRTYCVSIYPSPICVPFSLLIPFRRRKGYDRARADLLFGTGDSDLAAATRPRFGAGLHSLQNQSPLGTFLNFGFKQLM